MLTPDAVRAQIDRAVRYLVEVGLANDQTFAFRRDGPEGIDVTFQAAGDVSVALGDAAYPEIYAEFTQRRAYNARLPDGGLIQMMYRFGRERRPRLLQHRLAFFSAPHLVEFQNSPEVYLEDAVFADVVEKSTVPFPLRFDFDAREEIHRAVVHPKCHLTLGQYKNCRIPVSAPITPLRFVDFILRNFYNTAYRQYEVGLPHDAARFPDCILQEERQVMHVVTPLS